MEIFIGVALDLNIGYYLGSSKSFVLNMMLKGGCEAILLRRSISSLLGGLGLSFIGDVCQDSFLYAKTEKFLVNEDLDPTDLICDLVTVMSPGTLSYVLQSY